MDEPFIILSIVLSIYVACFSFADDNLTTKDLVTPEMTHDEPAAGRRVHQVAPEYSGTEVYHALYLPVDWEPGKSYPVIIEYTGNRFAECCSSGEVKDANLGYGLTGGKGFHLGLDALHRFWRPTKCGHLVGR